MENQPNPPTSPSPSPNPTSRPYVPLVVAAFFFVSLLVGGGYFALRGAMSHGLLVCGDPEESELPPPPQDESDYTNWEKKWGKPLVAIVVSGQTHGYINPCGCSHPQNGGLERRYNFIESLKAKEWDVVGIDLGDLADTRGIQEQNMLKYDLSVKALRAMNYRAVGIGRDEFRAGLDDVLVQAWDGKPHPRPLLMSLADRDKHYAGLNVRPFEVVADTTPKIGIINMFGPDLRKEIEPKRDKAKPKFLYNEDELPKALDAFAKAGVEFGVILHHEYPKLDPLAFPEGSGKELEELGKQRLARAHECAKFCADARRKNPKIPPIHLMMVIGKDSEPPSFMTELDPKLPTHAIEIGHKGKYIGLVGVYGNKKEGYRTHYQKILMSPEWETPAAKKAKQPIIALMDEYHLKLKAADMLAKAPRSLHFNQLPAQNQKGLAATYVGSNKCKSCHMDAYKVWAASDHAKATKTLEDEKLPSNRHYDPECMKCHTTGFQHPGGYNDLVTDLAAWPKADKPAPDDLKEHNTRLRNIGCESCHGPASEHVKDTDNMAVRKLINPYRPTDKERKLEDALVKNPKDAKALETWLELSTARRRAIESSNCIKCHDQENDVHWGNKGKDIVARWLLDPKRLIHHKRDNNGAGAGAAKEALAPAANGEPPLVIEVVPPEKKQ